MRVHSTLVAGALIGSACSATSTPTMTKEQLGSAAFADQNLSQPAGQACADCHATNRAFSDPESDHSTVSRRRAK